MHSPQLHHHVYTYKEEYAWLRQRDAAATSAAAPQLGEAIGGADGGGRAVAFA